MQLGPLAAIAAPVAAATILAATLAAEAPDLSATSTTTGRDLTRDPADRHEIAIERAALRLREGTQLRDVAGRFRQSGDSLTFIDREGREILGLPNLNLERILRTLKSVEEPESIIWSVSGAVTEFGGRNHLLVSRAVYKAAAPPPTPESLLELEKTRAEEETNIRIEVGPR